MRVSLALLAGAMTLAGTAHAQNTGSVFGSVQDKSGAIVRNATITITDSVHGVTRTTTTSASGEFQLPSLPIGDYILTVSAPTFQTEVITDLKLDADQNIKELVKMSSGAATDTVTVVDESGSAIDAKSATLGTLIDQKMIEDLPIDGHNVVALSALLPGVVDVNAPSTFTGDTKGPTYSASGSRNTQNLMLFDGLMWNNLFYNTGINYPSPNALQEVSVQLNNYKAQYGRNAGSVFNVITKSGTNTFHGAVWDYMQNQMFNASDYITDINPKDNIHQWGFTVGGPILKDKLYFFGAFQDLVGRLQTTASALTPGYAERGLLSDGVTPRPCSSAGAFPGHAAGCASFFTDTAVVSNGVLVGGKFINPLEVAGTSGSQAQPSDAINMINAAYAQAGGTGSSPCLNLLTQAANFASNNPYAGTGKVQPTYLPLAEVPNECLNPVMSAIFKTFVPVPGSNGSAVTTSPAPTGDKNILARLDYNPAPQHRFDIRYNFIHSNALGPQGVSSASQGVAGYAILNKQAYSNFGNVGWVWVVSPTIVNELRVGYKRFESTQYPQDTRTLNTCVPGSMFCGNFVETGQPTLPAFNFSNGFALGASNQGYQDAINENVEMSESLTYSRGAHTFKLGYNFLRLQYLNRQDYPGLLGFSSTFTGLSVADGLIGLVNTVDAQNRLIQGGIQHNDFFYLQDDWRLTSKMTLNLGIRYELPFQWFEPHGQSATFKPGLQSTVFPQAPGGLGFPGDKGVLPSLVPTDFNGFAPRVGFAYDTTGSGKLLVRGGFGIFFDAVNANVIGVGEPYNFKLHKILPPGGASVPLATYGANGGVLTLPAAFDPKNPVFVAPYSIFFPDPNFRTPYVLAANFGFQYHVPRGGVFEANYVGKFARKLTVPLDLNPSISDCSGGYYQSNPNLYCSPLYLGANGQPVNPNGTASSSASSTQARVRYAPFNYGGQGIVDILSVGTANYNALQVQYTQRGGKLLTILSSYTYSRSIDIQTNAQTTSNSVPNVFNLASDKGPSDSNATHNFTLGWVQRFPKITQGYAPVRALLNNWIYSGQYLAHTGKPYSVTINNDSALDGESNQRAQILPGVNPNLPSNRHRSAKVAQYFNRDAFTYPSIGTFSNQGRNSFVGPGYIMTNMTLGRDFPLARIREGMRLNFRAEAFNVFNTPNLANPSSQFSCTTTTTYTTPTGGGRVLESCPAAGGSYSTTSPFGVVRSTYGNNANTSTNGRKMQFALTVFY
ncbi:TonB-dependent receptor [Granulicella rosea]|nr:carboxypeptidase regulatory-like domain-containing protein [Granulicella rosea]